MNKRVLVIVVTYNGKKWLERCLGAVCPVSSSTQEGGVSAGLQVGVQSGMQGSGPAGLQGHVQADLYVFDNDSTDGSADFVEGHFPHAKLIRSAENLGFSRPNNLGFEYAMKHGYDYAYLLNQDAWLELGALDHLVAAAEANPHFAVLSPLQMTDGYKSLDRQFEKILRRSASQNDKDSRPAGKTALSVPDCAQNESSAGKTAHSVPDCAENESSAGKTATFVTEVRRVMAAHWLVPVEVLKRVGLFNEELFPMYGQDDDWCNRARCLGYRIGVVPGARAVHDREYREEPLEKLVYRNYYTGSLVRLANPGKPFWGQILFVLAFTFVKIAKFRSWLPVKYLRTIFGQFSQIRASRMRTKCA